MNSEQPAEPQIDWELQARYDNDADFRAMIDEAIDGPRVERPRRHPRERSATPDGDDTQESP